MRPHVLIVGGSGRIGAAVARDLARYAGAGLTITGRRTDKLAAVVSGLPGCVNGLALDLDVASVAHLQAVVGGYDLVLQCVGPFRNRPPALMLACLAAGVNYVDVCDDRQATAERLAYDASARKAGVTALIDTGTFPGIDSVLVAEAIARNPEADTVRLHFLCEGSGGGGFGVLQTTFLAVCRPCAELVDGAWIESPSYGARMLADFGQPIGRRSVYAFEVPEVWSLAHSFPRLRTVTSRFGTSPELWNWATWALARAPGAVRANQAWLDAAAGFTLPYVHRLDRFVGEALGIRIDIEGPGLHEVVQFFAESTTEAVGWGTGIAAQMVLDGTIGTAGVHLPETAIPPAAYIAELSRRGARIVRTMRYNREVAIS